MAIVEEVGESIKRPLGFTPHFILSKAFTPNIPDSKRVGQDSLSTICRPSEMP